jgi:hypothetical protein
MGQHSAMATGRVKDIRHTEGAPAQGEATRPGRGEGARPGEGAPPADGGRRHGGSRGLRARALAAYAAMAGLAAASVYVVAGAQSRLDVLVPAAEARYPDWLRGPLAWLEADLSHEGLAWLLIAMCAAYLVVLAAASAVRPGPAIASIVGLHLLFVLAPPLLSSDVFGYIDLGRLGAVHGIDPYSSADTPLPDDDVYLYRRWGTDLPSPYGPLFVAGMYPLGALGVPAALWSLKALLGAASLAVVALVWRTAHRLGRDPVPAALFVGLNPILLLWGVGGAHNDFLFVLAMTAAVAVSIEHRERLAGGALTLAAAVKASAALPLVFMLAGARRRGQAIAGSLIAALACLVLTAAVFGTDVLRFLDTLRDQQHDVALFSFPNQLGDWLGFGGITTGIRGLATLALVVGVAWLLVRTWRGRTDWVTAAGWATALLLVTTAWLLPWYLVWLLPLAALSGDRRLRLAALAIGAFVVYTRVDLWFELAPGG